jgi:nicotinic acid phosphoribosyltransferase
MLISEIPAAVLSDSYKAGHPSQYPDNVIEMSAYGEFRKPMFDGDYRIVFFGGRYYTETFLNRQWTMDEVDKATAFYSTHCVPFTPHPFPEELFRKFVRENNGYFPVKVEMIPDGTVLYPHVPVYQITAKGEYSKLVTFLETVLTMVWHPSNVATLAAHARKMIQRSFDLTVDEENHWKIGSRLHDFGFRGTSSIESAVLGGMGHLLSFEGSDTMAAAYYAQYGYNDGKPVAMSIPATEHSVMTAWPDELSAVRNMFEKFPGGLLATVGDSYDWNKFLNNILPVLAKEKPEDVFWVLRPDSGDPVECVISGLKALEKNFPTTVNSKGYKVIEGAGIIQGDGLDIRSLLTILDEVERQGYSVENVAFGMGGGLLQKHNRDTMAFATKLSQIIQKDGTIIDKMKTPKTDGGKFSMPGRFKVWRRAGHPVTIPEEHQSWEDTILESNLLRVVYDCGPIDVEYELFDETRARLRREWDLCKDGYQAIHPALELKMEKVRLQNLNL